MRFLNMDVVRGFGIILVVFGHVWRGLERSGNLNSDMMFETVDRAIYLFHMPLFFFLSGLFFIPGLLKKGFGKAFKARILLVLYPLVIWSYIHFLFKYLLGSWVNNPITMTELIWAPVPPKEHFWFLWALFLNQTILSLAIFKRAWMKPAFVIVGLFALGISMFGLTGRIPPLFMNAFIYLPYFVAGCLLAKYALTPQYNYKSAVLGACVFVVAQLIYLVVWQSSLVAIKPIIAFACIFGTVTIVSWIASTFSNSLFVRYLSFIGRASFPIFLIHVIFASGARIILNHAGIHNIEVHIFAGVFAGITGPLAIYWFAKINQFSLLIGLGR